jgi:hypothetical protein
MDAMRSLLVVLVTAVGLVVLGPSTAYACSCATGSPRDYTEWADVVVEGTVVEKAGPDRPRSSIDTVVYTLEVSRVFKGEAGERLEFGSVLSGASCGLEGVNVKHEGVFFLYRPSGSDIDPDTELAANLCGGSLSVTPAQVERVTGEGQAPTAEVVALGPVAAEPGEDVRAPQAEPGRSPWPAYVGGAALLLLAAAAAGWWVRRRPA